jgi:hypothetical protein
VKGCKSHPEDVEVHSFACHTLAVMAGEDTKMHEHITQMSGAIYMMETLTKYHTNADLTSNVLRLLANLSLTDVVRTYIFKKGAVTLVIRGLKEHTADTDVQHFAFAALANFANDLSVREKIAKEVGALVHKSLAALTDDADVQITGTVRVFRQEFTLKDAIGSHACSLEANMHMTNGIPLGSSLLLPVGTVNCVQTLKALPYWNGFRKTQTNKCWWPSDR